MRLSARSEYGLLALVDLAMAPDGTPMAAREISTARGIPPAFLEQLLADLRRAGIVRATRGARGGFTLTHDPATVTALEVVEALEGPIVPSVCAPDACGQQGSCGAATVWADIAEAVRDALGRFTLADLASGQARIDQSPLTCTTRRSD